MSVPINSFYRQARFLKSAQKISQLPKDAGFEVAFAGRSNAGKSSALNALTDQQKLARTSKTPGRTQLLNFFELDDERRLVDLPGYGYAKVKSGVQEEWAKLIDDYLASRQSLAGVVLIMDARHPLQSFDDQMLEWAAYQNMPIHILLTKADKLNKNPQREALMQVQKAISHLPDLFSVQLFSALKKQGLNEFCEVLDKWLNRSL